MSNLAAGIFIALIGAMSFFVMVGNTSDPSLRKFSGLTCWVSLVALVVLVVAPGFH